MSDGVLRLARYSSSRRISSPRLPRRLDRPLRLGVGWTVGARGGVGLAGRRVLGRTCSRARLTVGGTAGPALDGGIVGSDRVAGLSVGQLSFGELALLGQPAKQRIQRPAADT